MAAASTKVARARGVVAGLSYAIRAGVRPPDCPELVVAKDNLRAVLAVEAAERLLAMLPQLTDEGRIRVMNLIETSLLEVSGNGTQ